MTRTLRSPLTSAEIQHDVDENGPVSADEISFDSLPEAWRGESGGVPFLGVSAMGRCSLGPVECVWEIPEGRMFELDFQEPGWIYVVDCDGIEVLVGGSGRQV